MGLMAAAYSAAKVVNAGKPFIIYGTAWKKERTAELVAEAVRSGFRFIDTACQPKHYKCVIFIFVYSKLRERLKEELSYLT